MISNHDQIFVWIWLPEATKPVVAGKLIKTDKDNVAFVYGQSYLKNPDRIPISKTELPLSGEPQKKRFGHEPLFGCIRDASPDSWGKRIILNKLTGKTGRDADTNDIDELTYLMESDSDRIGGLDFQATSDNYAPRQPAQADLDTLLTATEYITDGKSLPQALAEPIQHGTGIGGARPKAFINADDKKYIAKFPLSTDTYNMIKAEFVAMRLAKKCGLNVAEVSLTEALGKDVLLIERFDRIKQGNGWARKLMVSALTLLELDELSVGHAGYEDFAEIIRSRFIEPKPTLKEMFGRIVFNILCCNTDDHARNHSAFWDGRCLALTPAYDICPQLRLGGEATQGMKITGDDRTSRLVTCIAAAESFMLTEDQARQIIDGQIATINAEWCSVSTGLSPDESGLFRERLFMPCYAFEGYADQASD